MREKNMCFKALLLVDNATCHTKELNHPNVKIVFFPPNCTSIIQPLDQGIIQTFKMYYVRQFFQTIFDRLENDENKTLIQVWKKYSILDCVRTVSSACAELKPTTLHACWKPLLPQMVQRGNDISFPHAEIINIASTLTGEGFEDINHQDIEELLREETLTEDELMASIDTSTSNTLVNENMDKERANFNINDVKKVLDLGKQLEIYSIENDPSTVRSAKFKRELQNCLAPYRKILVELQNKITFENENEDMQSEEDIRPIKRRKTRPLIFDSDDEC